ncbi:MAG: hypothetical protein V3T86_01095 [Planctomycetota bacterium]
MWRCARPVVACLVGGVLAACGSNDDSAPTATPPPQKKLSRIDQANNWYRDAALDGLGELRSLPIDELEDILRHGERYAHIAVFDWLRKKFEVNREIARRDPQNEKAHRAIGNVPLTDYPNFQTVYRRFQDAPHLSPELQDQRARWESLLPPARTRRGKRLLQVLPQRQFDELKATLAGFAEYEKMLAADPGLAKAIRLQSRMNQDPLLAKFGTVYRRIGPFLAFYGSKPLKSRAEGANEVADVALDEIAPFLQSLAAAWKQTLLDPLGRELPKKPILLWMFEQPDDFGRHRTALRLPWVSGLAAVCDQRTWTFAHPTPADPSLLYRSLARELTIHLRRLLTPHPLPHKAALVLHEGWPEMFTALKPGGGFGGTHPEYLKHLDKCRRADLPLVPLRFLLRRESHTNWRSAAPLYLAQAATQLLDPLEETMERVRYLEAFRAHSWLVVKFLHDGNGGKYRAKLMKYTAAALDRWSGYSATDAIPAAAVFAAIFELPDQDAWAELQREFDAYLNKSLG